jgi:hypothetical protein
MSKRYVYTLDGAVRCIQILSDVHPVEYVIQKTIFEAQRGDDLTTHFDPDIHHSDISVRECEFDDMPTRVFRDAWEEGASDGPAVQVNMPRARGIHMDRIRLVRNEELAKEDINVLKAIEVGDTAAQSTVATKKQTLRDIPQTFDLTTDNDTPDELDQKWPSELPARE